MSNVSYVSGTFSATGDSLVLRIRGDFSLNLAFASTGTVVLQRRGKTAAGVEQTWVDVQTYIANASDEGIGGGDLEYRLHCTAAGGNIEYWLGR